MIMCSHTRHPLVRGPTPIIFLSTTQISYLAITIYNFLRCFDISVMFCPRVIIIYVSKYMLPKVRSGQRSLVL